MALNAMKLNSRDMARARVMLRDQSKGEDPYDILDDEGDPENRDKRRVLIIWCFRSREDPDFTWDMAWDLEFEHVYAADDEEAEEGEGDPLTPGPGSGPEPNATASSKRRPRGAAPAPSSSSSSG
jgi:hypothetical protein